MAFAVPDFKHPVGSPEPRQSHGTPVAPVQCARSSGDNRTENGSFGKSNDRTAAKPARRSPVVTMAGLAG